MEIRKLVRIIAYDIINDERAYLLLKTKKGYWQNPQGGIDAKESEIEAILRETEEESGLKVKEIFPDTRISIEYDTERKGNELHVVLASYAARVDSSKEVILSPEEGHTEYRWVPYNEALTLLTRYPEQIQIFEQVAGKLCSILSKRVK